MASDKELADFLKSADRRAFKRVAYAVRDEDAALDIVQDSMLKLVDKYSTKPADELPLLFQRILQNTIRDHFRRQKVRSLWGTLLSSLSPDDEEDSDPLERMEIQEGANRGKDTPNAPRVITSWGAMYEHERSGLWIRFGGSHTGGAFKDLANTPVGSADGLNGPEPSYTLWDVALGWWQHPDHDGLAATIGVTNLFDEDYFRRFATGIYPGAPRDWQHFMRFTAAALWILVAVNCGMRSGRSRYTPPGR